MSDEKRLIDLLVEDNQTRKTTVLGIDVYVSQNTLADQAKVTAMFPDDADQAKRQAAFLILKCRDASGQPIFTADDRDALVGRVGATRFTQVWALINGSSVDDQAEK